MGTNCLVALKLCKVFSNSFYESTSKAKASLVCFIQLVSSSLDGSNDVQVAIDLVQTFFAIPNKPNSLSPFPHRGWTTQDHPMLYLLRNSWEFMLNVFNPETDLPPNEVSEEVIAKMTRDWIDQVKKYLVPFDQVWSELVSSFQSSSLRLIVFSC